MDRKSVSAAVLVVAASIFYPHQSSRSATETTPLPAHPTSATTAANLVTPSVEGPWKPICDHFGEKKPSASKQSLKVDVDAKGSEGVTATFHAEAENNGEQEPLAEQYCVQSAEAKRATFRTMIVLAPDPELTHLSLDFDRTMESIVWAISDGGFSFESYWFPWQNQPDKEETDPDKRKSLKKDQDERLQKPGMLLFRGANDELLAVFVVGDRPDFGPSRIQFQAAVDGIHVLHGDPKHWTSVDIPVVGPSFSGSIEPLKRLIESNLCDRFFVVTGRATNGDEIAKFPKQASSNAPSLCSTVENDGTALEGFAQFAKTWGLPLGAKAALLNEDETAYGSLEVGDFVQFRFPRGISRLRNSVEELPGLNAQTSNNGTGYQALPLILKESGEDTLRSFSEQLTPVSSEAVLLNIAVSLRRMQIHYAGILATDPLDALFLARFLRIAAPDVRLFFLQSDALYVREAHNWNLEGAVAITNYPLVLEDQYGAHPRDRISFASGYEEATYNACRRVMFRWSDDGSSRDCAVPDSRFLPKNKLVGYQSPFPSSCPMPGQPALWVTILGHDSFWPVALLEADKTTLLKGPLPAGEPKPFNPGPSPMIWRALLLGLLAFSITHVVFAGLNVPGVRNWTFLQVIRRYDSVRNFSIRFEGLYAGGQAASISIMSLCLALANTIFLVPAVTFHSYGSWCCAPLVVFFVAQAICMTVLAIRRRKSWSGAPLLALIPWTVAIASALLLLVLWNGSKTSHAGFFFIYRSVHIDNGVSPAAPLLALAAGFYYWAWIQSRRFRLADELRPEMPDTVIAPQNFMGELEGVFGKKAVLLFGLVTMIFFLIFCPFIYVHTVEGRAYDYLIAMSLLAIYAMLIGSLVRFGVLWSDLRTILQFLERHPLREAFTRLPHTFSWTSIWNGDLRPTYLTVTRSRDCLRRLIPIMGTLIDEHVDYIQEAQANNTWQFQPSYFDLWIGQEDLFKRASYVIEDYLQPHWQTGTSDSIEEAKKTSLDPERTAAPAAGQDELVWFAEEFLALRYVALIRYVFFQMRNFLEFVTAGFILMVMAVYVYPFEDHRLLGAANITMFGLLATGMLIAFAQMDRDPILSRLSSTKPRLDMNFVWRVVSYGSLPVLALLGSQFPTIGNFLFSWVQPALQSMK